MGQMKRVYCYTGSSGSSTYFDAYFIAKYSKKFKYSITSGEKYPPSRSAVILFTDPGTFCAYAPNFAKFPHKIVCWWHGDKSTPNRGVRKRIPIAEKYLPKCAAIIVSCDQGYESVRSIGVKKRLITRIPLGVDLSLFKPKDSARARLKLGIPLDSFCVGSFQRDTDKRGGPKVIKGPDILVDVLEILHKDIPHLFVLLSGRRRSYVSERLRSAGIPFKHSFVEDYVGMPRLYSALDCYLIAARVEGGPKGLMEAPACNVPVVSTDCGMARDAIQEGVNGYICAINDSKSLAARILQIYNGSITGPLRTTIEKFDYESGIIKQYESLFRKV